MIDADARAVFLPPDWVLFGRDEALYAQRLDLASMAPLGNPRELVWVRRDGTHIGTLAGPSGLSNFVAGRDIWALPVDGDRKPFAVVRTPFDQTQLEAPNPIKSGIAPKTADSWTFKLIQRVPAQ